MSVSVSKEAALACASAPVSSACEGNSKQVTAAHSASSDSQAPSPSQTPALDNLPEQAFVHVPQKPRVTEDYPEQRYFMGSTDTTYVGAHGGDGFCRSSVQVYRNGRRHEGAQLEIEVESTHGVVRAHIYLTASELREVARRLLDAAQDSEDLPVVKKSAEVMA